MKSELIEKSFESLHALNGGLPCVADDQEVINEHKYMNTSPRHSLPEDLSYLLSEVAED